MTTGYLMTADGSDDQLIQPMVGLAGGYSIPEVAAIDDDADAPPAPINAVPADPVLVPTAVAADQDAIEASADGEAVADHADDDGSVLGDDLDGPDADDADATQSWGMALEAAAALDTPVTPAEDDARVPKPVLLTGRYALLHLSGEWELVKVDNSAPGEATMYRYKVQSSLTYGHYAFPHAEHGRDVNGIATCWV